MHPVATLKTGNQAVGACDRQGVAANEQRMKTHHHPQFGIAQMLANHGINRTPGAHAHHIRNSCKQIPQALEGNAAEFFKAQPIT
ncbi:MAG: hypothetical protein EBX56_02805, partial [Betaproteobacteria bacterium]|nr:hypothetical protein [Betaproteobacteria bacterium]